MQPTTDAAPADWAELALLLPVGIHVYALPDPGRPEGLMIAASNAAADRLVSAGEPVAGRRLIDAFPALASQRLVEAIATVATTGRLLELPDVRFTHGDGRRFDLKAFALPGGRIGVLFEETTERRRVEEALLQLGWQQEALLTATDQGMIGFDAAGRISFANPSAERMLAYGPGELIGRAIASLALAPGEAGPGFEPFTAKGHRRFCRKDGSQVDVSVTSNPILERGLAAGGVCAFRDITELLRMKADLEQARDQAEEANRAKSLFLATMTHELRTPLNAIIGYTELLLEEAADLGVRQITADLEKIQTAGRHLLGLINDILDLSKIEAGKMDLLVEECNLPELAAELATAMQPMLARAGNTLETRVAPVLPWVMLDVGKLRQVLFNLLSNACKFTHAGHISLEVEGQREGGTAWLSLRVRDEGIGMSPEQLAKLFRDFTQVDASTTRKYGGTGLGLALSQRLCELMGGRIEVESEQGRGTCFTVRLPAAPGSMASLDEVRRPAWWAPDAHDRAS